MIMHVVKEAQPWPIGLHCYPLDQFEAAELYFIRVDQEAALTVIQSHEEAGGWRAVVNDIFQIQIN